MRSDSMITAPAIAKTKKKKAKAREWTVTARSLISAAAAVVIWTCAIATMPARAASLLGNTISGSYHVPTQGAEISFTSVAFHGPVFSVVSGNPFDPIFSVVASGGQSVAAFLSGGDLFVNWQGQSFADDDTITITFAESTVPLPAALPLFAAGLGVMGLFGWRRKRYT